MSVLRLHAARICALVVFLLPGCSIAGMRASSPRAKLPESAAPMKTAAPTLSTSANRARKQKAAAAQQKLMDAKLEADASFFWQCVSKHAGGGVIAGASGLVPVLRDEQYLFGSVLAASSSSASAFSSGIDFTRYDGIPVTRTGAGSSEDEVPPMDSFTELRGAQLPSWACDNLLDRMHYGAPTPIQKHAVPLALASYDLIGCAQTGSGKTTAFLLPLLARIAGTACEFTPEQRFERLAATAGGEARGRSSLAAGGGAASRHASDGWRLSRRDEAALRARGTPAKPSALVLAPTRELAMQIELEAAKLCYDAPPPPSGAAHWSACAYGGATARPQLEHLAAGVEILVATPGRLTDFVSRSLVDLSKVRFLVLDEADRMLDMGFAPQIERLVALLPSKEERQTLMFSATFAPPIQRVAQSFLRGDGEAADRAAADMAVACTSCVTIGRVGSAMKSIEQRLVRADASLSKRGRLELIRPLLTPGERTIVFCGKKHVAKWVAAQLSKHDGTRAVEIHGDRSQGQREAALNAFRSGRADVLVATDVASRGIDVPDVAHVIQYDLPTTAADFDAYVHRIGRTGRAGKAGRATSVFVPGDVPRVGNDALWVPLARLLDENEQEVPTWFDDVRPRSAAPRATAGGVAAGGGGVAADGSRVAASGGKARGTTGLQQLQQKPAKSSRRRGASMNRRARRAAAAAAAGRPPNAGPP